MTDFVTNLRRITGELRDINSGDPVTRGQLAGFFEVLADTIVREHTCPGPIELTNEDIKVINESLRRERESGGSNLISSQEIHCPGDEEVEGE